MQAEHERKLLSNYVPDLLRNYFAVVFRLSLDSLTSESGFRKPESMEFPGHR